MENFVIERDKVFISAVTEDDWEAVIEYAKKYGIPIPKDKKIMMAGIYKAVQDCTKIPDEVKAVAMTKCLELGFHPFIKP